MNKIGFNILPWTAGVTEKAFPILDRLKKIGYDGVEVFIGSPDEEEYRALAKHAHDLGLEVNAVTTLGENESPISTDTASRSRGLDRIKWAIDRAHDLGSTILCGPFHSAHGYFSRAAPTDQEYHWAAETLRAAGDHAQQAGITLTPEAVNRFENYLASCIDHLAYLIDLTDHPHVKGMYDTHHANIEEKSMRNSIQKIAPVLAHVHISENDRGTPGRGLVHWDEVFQTLNEVNYSGWYTIEAFSRADPDFANAINVWREYSDPWEIAEHGYHFIKNNLVNFDKK